jgi:hypothetical protein
MAAGAGLPYSASANVDDGDSGKVTFDVSLRAVADHVEYSNSPVLAPQDRQSSSDYSQARVEFGVHSSGDANYHWAFRGFARTDGNLALPASERPALVQARELNLDLPFLTGYVTLGRIVVGSGVLKINNLVDYLDGLSEYTERRSDFLPERLQNRIGQVGFQIVQNGDLGTVQAMWVPKIDIHDSNHQSFTLVRFTPPLGTGSLSTEMLAFRSADQVSYGLTAAASPTQLIQVYGELTNDRRWPLLMATENSVTVQQVDTLRAGIGVEYKPTPAWSIALEADYNNRPVGPSSLTAAQNYLATAPLTQALPAAGTVEILPFGEMQKKYIGMLARYDLSEKKLSLVASYYRCVSNGDDSGITVMQAKWDIAKNLEASAFVKAVSSRAGEELYFAAEKRRAGFAVTIVLQ